MKFSLKSNTIIDFSINNKSKRHQVKSVDVQTPRKIPYITRFDVKRKRPRSIRSNCFFNLKKGQILYSWDYLNDS